MRELELSGLTVRVVGGADRQGGGDGPLVVLLHGFGAPGDDLVALHRVIDAPAGTRWAFPAAPLDLAAAFDSPWAFGGPVDARAWWMIDMRRRQLATQPAELEALSREVPTGAAEARERIAQVLDALESELRPPKVVLGGFSQGAMLSCDLALRTPRALAGLAILSGTPIAAGEWAALAPRRRGLAVFQSHGTDDPLLPFAYAEKLRDTLRAGGAEVTWAPFRGAHAIPDTVIHALGRWLRVVLG